MRKKDSPVDFTIMSAPVEIRLECPHCTNDIRIPWNDVDHPDCWQDDWGWIECPECGEDIKLGEYDYD